MPEMYLSSLDLLKVLVEHLLKTKQRIQKSKETGDAKYIYRNELDKGCFQHDMAYEDFKDIARRTASDKVLKDKVFNLAKDPKYDWYQRVLASMVYKFFDKKSVGSGVANNEYKQNLQLVEELHKPIIRNFKKEQFILDSKTVFGVLI